MDSRHVFRVKWGSPRDREVRCPESSQLGADLNLRKALFALMKYNWSCSRLLDEVLHQSFGEGEQFSLDSSFFGVVADLLSEGLVQLSIEQLTCLLLSKLSHPDADIRQRAFQLTVSLDSTPAGRLRTAALLPAISSPSANLYRHAQKEMAVLVASNYQEHALAFLAESTTRLSQLEAPRRQATLSILPAWLAGLDFAPDPLSLTADEVAKEHRALSNLIYLAIRFVDDHLEDIKEVLIAFAGSGQSRNTTALVRFLFEQGAKRKSLDFVTHAQSTMACLAQSPAGEVLFEELCSFVEPSAMAALPEVDVPPSPMASLADLDALVSSPTAMSQTFSTGQLALLFAGQLLPSRLSDIDVGTRLPRLLHAALLHCDHASASLRDKCQAVLFQVLRAWICDVSNVPGGDGAAMWATAELKTTMLARSRPTAFWKAEEDGGPEAAFLAPPKMTTLIMKVLGILLPLQPRIRQVWGELALSWATSCPIRHCACRSFQVFRILSPRISPCMVSDTLARLSSTVASGSPEMKSFNQEVIRTFASAVQGLPAGDISQYPQLFWCTVACLTTPVEDEYAEVTELLSHVLDKTNLSNPAVVQHLLSFRPIDWSGPPPRLQALLLAGLRSSKTALMTFDLIRRLVSAPHDDLIDATEDRLLHGFIAALPWMLHSIDLGEPNEELAMMALDLAAIADASGNASFSRLLVSFAHARFRAKDDFIRQASSLLRDFMPSHALDILTILAGFVLNSHDWMREKSMQVLKLVLLSPEARPPLSANGNELLQPLLRLVSTKHSAQALDLLDLMNIDPIPGSASGDIFGPIEESGWSVSHATELSTLTRKNVTAVFNTCAVETRAASAHFSVVQFTDMRGFGRNPSQLSLDIPSPPTSATDEASMGDLVGALHSLNQFFDDGLESAGSGATERKGHAQMPSETVSERRVRAIMGVSGASNLSNFAELLYSAFAKTISLLTAERVPTFPQLHQRATKSLPLDL